MDPHNTNSSERLAKLLAKLNQAQAKASHAGAELKLAERRAARADDAVAELRGEVDSERLRLWGPRPDVAELLRSDGSMALYRAGEALADAYGLGWGMKWSDTDQTVLHIRLNRGDRAGLERAKAAVLFFAPHVKSKGGLKRFGVMHRESGEFGLELRYSMKSGAAAVGRLFYGTEDEKRSFATLEGALVHIQEHHWIEDIIDLPAPTVLLG